MATLYQHRLLVVCPLARVNALNTWLRNNLDATGGNWLTLPLSASGAPPATHYACSAALTAEDLRRLLALLSGQAGVAFPPTWGALAANQKMAWVRGVAIPGIRAALGVRLQHVRNDGDWGEHDPPGELWLAGLQVVAGPGLGG